MSYLDAFMCAVPTANKEAYIEQEKHSAAIFRAHGATSITSCWGTEIPDGELTSMIKAVQCKEDETVVLGWITWRSREDRDNAWAKLHEDKQMQGITPPFDGKRMIFGGFDIILEE